MKIMLNLLVVSMKRNLESARCLLVNCCNSFSMLCEILPRYTYMVVSTIYGSLKVKWL